jgi:hypothetical protein
VHALRRGISSTGTSLLAVIQEQVMRV